MSENDENSGDDEKTRIYPSKKPAQNAHSDNDLIGTGDDATAFRKPFPSQSRSADRDSAKTERAQDALSKTPLRSKSQQKLGSKDRTEAAIQSKAPQANRLQTHGTLKNRFVLGRILGAGGMGVVYKAKDLLKVEAKDRDPFVAIKVLGEEFKAHPEAFIALQRESRKTQKIAHPNIVNVYDFDKDGDTVFMTMEFLDGSPLDKVIKKYKSTAIPRDQAWEVLQGICSALAYAHEQNIIHADLKPGNIFVTQNNTAKVFDFGIARAVANAEQNDFEPNHEDKTFFDAGNLGALTPAYASLEMLEGETPDIRDDVYALGCIAYELFTGKHPYQRKNARDAMSRGLKPERIPNISKQQWKAIEKALSFEREDRIRSANEFWSQLSQEHTIPYKAWLAISVIFLFSAYFTYDSFFKTEPDLQPIISVEDVANEAERKVRTEIAEGNLRRLFNNPIFDERWEKELQQAMLQLIKYVGVGDDKVFTANDHANHLYTQKIESEIAAKDYKNARKHIINSRRYAPDDITANDFERVIASQIAKAEEQQRAQKQLALEKSKQLKRQKEKDKKIKQAARNKPKKDDRLLKSFNAALTTVMGHLDCKSSVNMDALSLALQNLQNIDKKLYQKSEAKIVSGLAGCIKKIALNYPTRAKSTQQSSLVLFNNNPTLASIHIESKDPCREGLAGQGSRGKRSICRDVLMSGGRGPRLVVIPSNGNVPVFAIGRYETTMSDLNLYCSATGCQGSKGGLPATSLSIEEVKAYLRWLSKESGQKYRLPTEQEWVFAAKAKGRSLNSNRNCKLNSRGIQKGGALVNATVGQQNGWGLVNHIGNAQEWVSGSSNQLLVIGGSYNTQMEECSTESKNTSDGKPNDETGFRVLREITKK